MTPGAILGRFFVAAAVLVSPQIRIVKDEAGDRLGQGHGQERNSSLRCDVFRWNLSRHDRGELVLGKLRNRQRYTIKPS